MTKGGWPPGESESGVGTARMPAGLARGARGSAPTGARGRCSAWTGTASAPVRRSRSRSWPRRPFPLRILVIAAVFVRLASAGPSPRQFSSQSRRFLPRRSLGQLGSYEDCHDHDRRPLPALSSRNGLHLVTKDAPLVTICSHKPRDAPRDTPGGGDAGSAGQARCHPGRTTPAFTPGSGGAYSTSKDRRHPGRRTPAAAHRTRHRTLCHPARSRRTQIASVR